jgi:hypothetical protein
MERISTDGSGAHVSAPSLTIRDIRSVHDFVMASLGTKTDVALSFDDGAAVDLSFVQLIESARHYAAMHGKTLRLSKPASANVRRVLERGGFLSSRRPDSLRFWLHEEVTA